MNKDKMPKNLALSPIAAAQCFVSNDCLERWTPVNVAESETTISILDVIGEDYWGEGVTAKRISAALRRIGDQAVTVNINSPGGNFFEGLAIYNLLRNHPQKVTVNVIALAGSAASFIAMAGDEINISEAGFLMIHNTQLCACGDRNGFQDIIETMSAFDDVLSGIYATRTGASKSEIAKMLDQETWISGANCIEQGFADALLEPASAEVENRADAGEFKSLRALESALIAQNYSRSQRREIVRNVKGTPRAANTANTQNAVENALNGILSLAKTT